MWELALLALGQAAGPLLKKAAQRHVERFFGDQIDALAGLGKKKATVQAMERAWKTCVDLILREIRYLGDFEKDDPDFRAYFEPLKEYVKQDVVGSELLKALLSLEDGAPDHDNLRFGWAYLDDAPDMPDGFSWVRIADRYRKSLTTQRILSEDLRGQLDSQNLERIRALLEGHAGVQPEADEARYAERMREKYRVIDLSAMLPPTADERNQVLLRHAFVPQKVREGPAPVELPRDLMRQLVAEGAQLDEDADEHTAWQMERLRESYSQRPLEGSLETVTAPANRKIVLLGGPGSGKSTLTRYLLLTTLDDYPGGRTWRGVERPPWAQRLNGHLPLLAELREFIFEYDAKRCNNFLGYWHHLGDSQKYHLDQKWLHERLRSAPSLVLFDGLDEIFDARARERVMHAIVGFAGDYPQARVVVTSRPVGYNDSILHNGGFQHYAIEDLDDEQIETFVNGWFSHLFPDQPKKAEQRRQRILGAAEKSRSVRLLAGNPMLLTIMALIAQLRELPRERWRFYDHAAEVLCHHWDVNRHLEAEGLDDYIVLEDKKELLERIAAHMQEGEGGLAGNVIQEDELRAEVEGYLKRRYRLGPAKTGPVARRLIAQLRERNYVLCLRGPKLYGFVHRTFLEYFSATGLVRRLRNDPEYSIKQLRDDVFARRWREESWREVLRLIAGMVGERQVAVLIWYLTRSAYPRWKLFIEEEPPGNLALAIECLAEIRNLNNLEEECRDLLEAILEVVAFPGRVGGDALRLLLEERILPTVEEFRLPGTLELWFTDQANRAFRTIESIFLKAPVAKLATIWLKSRAVLTERATKDEDDDARHAALEALARSWPEQENIRTLLTERATQDENGFERSNALETLARNWPDREDTRALLIERAIQDESEWARSAALEALARGWADREDTRILLTERATQDKDDDARSAALRALARGWAEREDTRILLTERATQDKHNSTRRAALDALARGWADREDTRTLLTERAIQDENGYARGTALTALARSWPDREDTRILLTERATQDEHGYARRRALEALARGWADREDTRTLLAERATQDEHEDARCAAFEALARIILEPEARFLLSGQGIIRNQFQNPLEATPEPHIRERAEHLGISEEEARQVLADCEPILGWNPLDPPRR